MIYYLDYDYDYFCVNNFFVNMHMVNFIFVGTQNNAIKYVYDNLCRHN